MMETRHIKSVAGFFETADLYRDQNFQPFLAQYYRRIILEGRRWAESREWLEKGLEKTKNQVYFLLRLAVLMDREHEYHIKEHFEPSMPYRYSLFKDWLERKLMALFPPLEASKSAPAEEGYTGEEEYIIDVTKINKSFKAFNGVLFNKMPYRNYLCCFDGKHENPVHPDFIKGKGIDFVYFLQEIPDIKVNNELALNRFGIRNFKARKRSTKPEPVFRTQVQQILKE